MSINNPILDKALNTISLEAIKEEMGPPNWARRVVAVEHVEGCVICQGAGTVNDRHCHDYDEWWVVLEGEIDWVIEGRGGTVHAKAGDFIFVPARTFHQIFPKGDGPSIRLALALPGSSHLHERPERKAKVTITSGAMDLDPTVS